MAVTFHALGDPTRLAILSRLAEGEAGVGELARPFSMSQPAISHHIKVLEEAGLIERRRVGTRRPCRLSPAAFSDLARLIEEFRAALEVNCTRPETLLGEDEP